MGWGKGSAAAPVAKLKLFDGDHASLTVDD
jgi:hypothetical protein